MSCLSCQAELQSRFYSGFSVSATDNSPIVSIARQLYTHSKNVSLLCSLYTKRCLFHSCWANTGPSYNQPKEPYKRKEGERSAAVWNRNETITTRHKKSTQRKWTKENTGKGGVRTRGQTRLAAKDQDIVVELKYDAKKTKKTKNHFIMQLTATTQLSRSLQRHL